MRLLALLGFAWMIVGCSFEGSSLKARTCTDDLDCDGGAVCWKGYCVDGLDAVLDTDVEEPVVCGDQTCTPGTACCDAACVDVTADTSNCGACGLYCGDGETCEGGVCACGGVVGDASPACNTFSEACCDGLCTEVAGDVENCGGCGVTCGTDEICVLGQCGCSSGDVDCNDDPADGCETDLLTSVEHCGSCGTPCEEGELCCSGQCFSTETDAFNCGGCGIICDTSQLCADGACVCRSGLGDCDGDASSCETVLSNTDAHCGVCGNACEASESCWGGLCQCNGEVCAETESCCLDPEGAFACIDLQTSISNCGTCGVACGPGESCVAGQCVCGGTTASVEGAACDLSSGESCCPDDSLALVCADADGDFCTCGDGPRCDVGKTCCDGSCADVLSNTANCGACGNACPPSETCVSGSCRCPAGTTRCGGACVNLLSDNANCGACGSTCSAGNNASSASCQGGTCVQNCNEDYADCTSGSGCETYLDSDNACGRDCGTVVDCGGSIDLCVSDSPKCQCDLLVWVRCNPGERCVSYGKCGCGSGDACGDGQWCCNSSCVSVGSDPNNCGGCGIVCASGVCSGGSCQ